jgi:hypothetical protein
VVLVMGLGPRLLDFSSYGSLCKTCFVLLVMGLGPRLLDFSSLGSSLCDFECYLFFGF